MLLSLDLRSLVNNFWILYADTYSKAQKRLQQFPGYYVDKPILFVDDEIPLQVVWTPLQTESKVVPHLIKLAQNPQNPRYLFNVYVAFARYFKQVNKELSSPVDLKVRATYRPGTPLHPIKFSLVSVHPLKWRQKRKSTRRV